MNNLTSLVQEYKQTNNPTLMNKIYTELNPLIQTKASFIFYKKYYPLSLYNKCYPCQKCTNQLNSNCKTCKKCTCIKGTFNLYKSHLCELEDVESDLWLEILKIIKSYDVTRDFDTYLYASIWNILPSFLTMDFIKSIKTESLSKTYRDNTTGEKEDDFQLGVLTVDYHLLLEKQSNLEIIFDSCKTDTERNILKLTSAGYNQKEIGEQLNVTPQYICQVMKAVKERIKDILKSDK